MLPALFFCADVAHSHSLASVLRDHGAKVYPISGKTPLDERRRLIELLRDRKIDGLASCEVLSTGFDCPSATVACMARPTMSGLWYRQAAGRILRPSPAPQGPREYQDQALVSVADAIKKGVRNMVVVMPTGCGKTVVAAKLPGLLRRWKTRQPRPRLLFLVHRDELALQAANTFRWINPDLKIGIEKADSYAGDADIVIASVQTLGPDKGKRLTSFRPQDFDVVTDEVHWQSVHHRRIYEHMRVLKGHPERDPEAVSIGLTATPDRNSRLGLEEFFDEIVFPNLRFPFGIREAIQQGWLCDIIAHRVETKVDISLVRTTRDDFNVTQLENAVNTPTRNRIVAEKYLEVCELHGSNVGRKEAAIVVDFVDVCRHSLIVAPTLFGLGGGYDAKGRSLTKQVEEVEAAEQEHRGIALRQEPDIEHVRATLKKIDILASPVIPPEIRSASRLPWLQEGSGAYHLGLFDHSMLSVRQNLLGKWEVHRHHRGVAEFLCHGRSLQEAIAFAEKYVPPKDSRALNAHAGWRTEPPSEAQAQRLWQVSHKVRREFPKCGDFYVWLRQKHRDTGDFDKGKVSDLITAAMRP